MDTVLCEALCWNSCPEPEVLTQIKQCPLEGWRSFVQAKGDGMVPKDSHLQGTSWVKVTADFLWERDQGSSSRSDKSLKGFNYRDLKYFCLIKCKPPMFKRILFFLPLKGCNH